MSSDMSDANGREKPDLSKGVGAGSVADGAMLDGSSTAREEMILPSDHLTMPWSDLTSDVISF